MPDFFKEYLQQLTRENSIELERWFNSYGEQDQFLLIEEMIKITEQNK
jgi:hypothetical protein